MPSTWFPTIFHPVPSPTTVVASVNIFVVCEYLFTFLEGVDLHPVVIISTCSVPC